jgi:asparagine synthase (glutamine-hydrolysing)
MARWLQTDLKEYTQDILCRKSLDAHGLFNPGRVADILAEHHSRKQIHDRLIWSLVVFQTWYRLYIEESE